MPDIIGNVAGAAGAVTQGSIDIYSGHTAGYALGDVGLSFEGGVEGAAIGTTLCLGEIDLIGYVCGVAGGFIGSGGAHIVWQMVGVPVVHAISTGMQTAGHYLWPGNW